MKLENCALCGKAPERDRQELGHCVECSMRGCPMFFVQSMLVPDWNRLQRAIRKAAPAKCSTCKEAKFSRDLKRAAALAKRLTKEKQEEFDIATGYHKKWVAAERQLAEARERLQLRENDEGIWLHVKTAKAQGAVLVAPKDEPRGPIVMATLRAALGEGEGEGKGG